MPLAELMSQLQELSKIDKLRLMQFLATEPLTAVLAWSIECRICH
jgi:hypothetical protein